MVKQYKTKAKTRAEEKADDERAEPTTHEPQCRRLFKQVKKFLIHHTILINHLLNLSTPTVKSKRSYYQCLFESLN